MKWFWLIWMFLVIFPPFSPVLYPSSCVELLVRAVPLAGLVPCVHTAGNDGKD